MGPVLKSGGGIRCGAIDVMRIKETLGAAFPPTYLLPELPPDAIERNLGWLAPNHYDPAKKRFVMGTHTWLLRTRHHTILVDTCIGNHKQRPHSPGFHNLAPAHWGPPHAGRIESIAANFRIKWP